MKINAEVLSHSETRKVKKQGDNLGKEYVIQQVLLRDDQSSTVIEQFMWKGEENKQGRYVATCSLSQQKNDKNQTVVVLSVDHLAVATPSQVKAAS